MQGMDASGKDGATRNVFQFCNPSGIDAYSFKKPTEEEFAHDFMWRCSKKAPKKGEIMVFIRSHYEDILIQKVHNWIDDERREKRMNAINSWEDLLQFDNKTTVIKFYLHISPERQEEKLQERIDIHEKNWKHNPGDWEERKLWNKYREAYEYAINNSEIPWIVAPADKRWYRNYFIAQKVLATLENLNPQLPTNVDLSKA
jgi:PPK2 family polyphosphate:nucleotide phosphotransferase